MPGDATEILRQMKTTDAIRASAWDAVYEAKDADDLQRRLVKLPLPNEVRAQLWDTRFATGGSSDEGAFQQWYAKASKEHDLNPNPEGQFYDYRAAFRANARPDASGHWPSQFKQPGHPAMVVGGFHVQTGERVPGTRRASESELVELGWDPATAKQLSATQERPRGLATIGEMVADTGKGAYAGLMSTAFHGGDLIRRGLGMERVIDTPDAQAAMTPPDSMAGKVGFYGEQAAEFLAPLSKVTRATQGMRLLPRMGVEAATSAGVAGVQSGGDSGDMTTAAVLGAGIPAVAAVGRPVLRMVQRGASGAKEGGLGGAIANAVRTVAPGEPRVLLTQALKPRSTRTNFGGALDRALPELKATEEAIGRPINGIDDLLAATKEAKQRVWSQLTQVKGTAQGFDADLSSVADAMERSIPKKFRLENPEAADRLQQAAAAYRKRFSLDDAEQLLKETNAEMEGFYSKYPATQRKALIADPEWARLDAQAGALRAAIDTTLDRAVEGGGAAAKELRRRYGSLLEVEGEAFRRSNVAARQQPESLSEQIGAVRAAADMARGTWRVLHGDLTGAADIAAAHAGRSTAKAIKDSQTTDALIRRAFQGFSKRPVPVTMPSPRPVRGLLGPAPHITPPPADPSFVRSVPAEYGRPFYPSE